LVTFWQADLMSPKPQRHALTTARSVVVVACLALVVSAGAFASTAASAGVITCGGQAPTITGTSSPDVLVGTPGPDVIVGLGAHDVITGIGGDDVICGGAGVDDIDAGFGDDYVWGGADGTFEHREGDWIEGGPGDDHLSGGNDPSEIGGVEKREDLVVYENAAHGIDINLDEPTATGQGVDTIDGFFSVIGSQHADTITAGSETDVVKGLGGDDEIRVDSHEGKVSGGKGDDLMLLGYAVYGSGGDDEIRGALLYANGGGGSDEMIGTQRVDNYRGGRGSDVLRGRSGKDFLDGSDGDDLLIGGSSADWLRGSGDEDRLAGGAGPDLMDPDGTGGAKAVTDDVVVGGHGSDMVTYLNADLARGVNVNLAKGVATGAGHDRFRSVENATGTSFADVLLGNARENRLVGGEGDDVLAGRDGRDTLMPDNTDNDFAAPGDDTMRGGGSRDLVSYAAAAGGGGVRVDLRTGTASGRGEDALVAVEYAKGTNASDTLLGDTGSNRLYGLGGSDVLRGRAGVDLAVGGTGSDTCSAESTRSCEA
jgi:Ca2+-binding RTX toxin-like protein